MLQPSSSRHRKSSHRHRDRHLLIRSVVQPEPDLERIADTVITLTERLAHSGLTLDEHLTQVKKHQQIRVLLQRKGT